MAPKSTRSLSSLASFERFARMLVLDDGELWDIEPWQLDFIADCAGDGVDRPAKQETWGIVPEANGKSTMLAAYALYHCMTVQSAFVVMSAAARDQVRDTIFRQATGLVRQTPGLLDHFHPMDGYLRIECARTAGRIQVKAGDPDTSDGGIPSLVILDELHRHPDLALYRTWRGKLKKRGGRMIALSTAGDPASEFEQTREKMRQLPDITSREDTAGHRYFVRAASKRAAIHDYAIPTAELHQDFDLLALANPLRSITAEVLAEDFESPSLSLQHWLRLVCGVPARVDDASIGEPEWDQRGSTRIIPLGATISLGVDLGWKWDTTAIVPLWVPDDERPLFGPASILVPPRNGLSLEPRVVEQVFRDFAAQYHVVEVVMDPAKGGDQLASWLRDELGIDNIVVVEQSPDQMADVAEKFKQGIRDAGFDHSRDPGLKSHAMNAVDRPTADGRARFDRPQQTRSAKGQPRRVIDALIAAAMVYYAAVAVPRRAPPDIFFV
jgi:phage terminase large subunit-like protein